MTTPTNQRLILLIDSSAVLHKSHHGYPEKIGLHQNMPTNIAGIYGYVEYIRKVYKEFTFHECIHVLDPHNGSTYRKELYPEYKAHRPPTPEDLKKQKDLLPWVLESLGQKLVQIDGVESDDVLATYAQRYADRGDLVLILSPDKDLLQLVSDNRITVAQYSKNKEGINVHNFYDEAAVIQKFNCRADQVADFLAIVGDESDNIPGVFKAGEKTAAKWLEAYGDVETLITHAHEISGKQGENLRAVILQMPIFKKLTSAIRDVDAPDIETIHTEINPEAIQVIRQLLSLSPSWSLTDNTPSLTSSNQIQKSNTVSSSILEPSSLEPAAHSEKSVEVVKRSVFPSRGRP